MIDDPEEDGVDRFLIDGEETSFEVTNVLRNSMYSFSSDELICLRDLLLTLKAISL